MAAPRPRYWTGVCPMNDSLPLALLVQLPIPPPGLQPIQGNVPLAAAYLKLFARRRGLQSWAIDILPARLCNVLGDRALVAAILDRGPALVGFTCYLWNIQRTIWIARQLKAARPDLHILLGGPEITADNRWVLEEPCVDLAAIGEGEQTFVELLAALHDGRGLDGIAGLWSRKGDSPIFADTKIGTVPRAALTNLDLVSSPYIEGILDATEEQTMLMETSRGCRYRCKFCYYPKSYDSIYRMSAAEIEANLRHARERGVKEIYLLDPTLNQRPDFADLLRLLAAGNADHQFTYSAELRAEGIRSETARLLREANFQEVEVGLQSVDPAAQRLMGRHVSLDSFQRGGRAMLDEGIRVRVDLILGLPGDTVDSVRRGLEYLDRERPFRELQVFNLSVLPGTAFRQTAAELGLEYQPHPPYYVLKTPTLELDDLYMLMEEAQEVFGIIFDDLGPAELPGERWDTTFSSSSTGEERGANISPLPPGEGQGVRAFEASASPLARYCVLNLDAPAPSCVPAAASRSLAFTLWQRSSDFRARACEAAAAVRRFLSDNPHTTLQIVLEPLGDPRHLTAELLEELLAVSHESLSYLDWFYSLHPVRCWGQSGWLSCFPRASGNRWKPRGASRLATGRRSSKTARPDSSRGRVRGAGKKIRRRSPGRFIKPGAAAEIFFRVWFIGRFGGFSGCCREFLTLFQMPGLTQNEPRTNPERTQDAPRTNPGRTQNEPRTHPAHQNDPGRSQDQRRNPSFGCAI